MTPLPSPGSVIRVRLFWASTATNEFGSRFFIRYSGGPPNASDLNTFCTNISTYYGSDLAQYCNNSISLVNVEAVDLSSDSGAEGLWTGNIEGTRGTASLPEDVCVLVNFRILRRYRGGKPKLYLPPGVDGDLENESSWNGSYISDVSTAWGTFMASILADTFGSFDPVDNVNISFYESFMPFKEPSGRYRNIPQQRVTPLVDSITGHSVRAEIASQRRRRTAFVTP